MTRYTEKMEFCWVRLLTFKFCTEKSLGVVSPFSRLSLLQPHRCGCFLLSHISPDGLRKQRDCSYVVCDNWVFESVTQSANLNRVDHLLRFSL